MQKKIGFSLCAAFAVCTVGVSASATPNVFNGPTVTNIAGRDGWCETQMTNIVVREGSALDLSALVGNVPAGHYGWALPNADGSLRFEKRPNEKVRLYGSVEGNISYHRIFDGCKNAADRRAAIDAFVAQTKRMGMNFIRPHGLLDSAFNISGYKSSGILSEEELDARDYFLAACKREGIYLYIDIAAYVLRDKEKRSQIWKKAGVMVKEPSYWTIWENCARGILERVNRYTGIAWKDDPAVIGVMEYNEQATGAKIALQGAWKTLDPIVKRAYAKGFADWLAVNAPGVKGISENDETLPNFYGSDKRGRLLHRYLSELFINRAADYNSVIRSTGYKGLLTTFNSDVDYGATAARWKSSEGVAYNFHAGHPHGGGHGYSGARVSQRSVIDAMASGSAFCYGTRIRLADRPFIVTENSHAFWNYHRYEASLMLPAYGALNGYSGILWHEGASDTKAIGNWPRGLISVFKVSTSPVMRAATFLGAMLFHRGDVSESTNQIAIAVKNNYWQKHTADAPSTTQAKLSLVFKYGLTFPELERPASFKQQVKPDVTLTPGAGDEIEDGLWVSNVKENESRDFDIDSFIEKMKSRGILPKTNVTSPKDGIYQSVTGEITLDASKGELTVITPRTEAACLGAGKNKKLGRLQIDNTTESCCAALTSVDGLPLSTSRRMVFLWMTRESNQNMVTSEDGKTMVSMGSYPALIKGGEISFTANIENPKSFSLYLLDYSGDRLEKIPLSVENGKIIAKIDTAKLKYNFTPFFELVADESPLDAQDISPKEYKFSSSDGDVVGKINALKLNPGDKVLFRRGDLFRGRIDGKEGVTYGAWGEGALPTLCASKRNYADPSLWKQTAQTNIWRCVEKLHNVGIIVFNHNPQVLGAFDCEYGKMSLPKRNERFDLPVELNEDLSFRNIFSEDILELRSDKGNPGERFKQIEIGEHGHCIWIKGSNMTVENLHLTLSGTHGVGGSGMRTNITVRNCVIDWLGGSIIEGWKFGTARFGNGVEIWGGCDGFRVENNWIYQIYDTGITIQCNDREDFVCRMANVAFVSNRIENCFWSLEYYNARNAQGSSVENVVFSDNVCLKNGQGWGCRGREYFAPVLALGTSPSDVKNFRVERNIFDGSTGSIVTRRPPAPENAFLFKGNVYRQKSGRPFHRTCDRNAAGDFSLDPHSLAPQSEEYKKIYDDEVLSENTSKMLAQRYGDDEAHVEELGLRKGDKVVILGDSLTNQGLAVRRGGYIHRLTNALSRVHGEGFTTVIPLGYSGWHIPSWIETENKTRTKSFRYDTCGKTWDAKDVLDQGADVVIIFLGMNDILHPVMKSSEESQKAWIEKYRNFISILRNRVSPRRILLCTISPLTSDLQSRKNVIRREVNNRIRELAKEEKCGVVEIERTLDSLNDEVRRLNQSRMVGDFVHPSWGVGHAGIAHVMAEALGEYETSKIISCEVRNEVEKVLKRSDVFSVNQTALVSSLSPESGTFDYEVSWYLKSGCDSKEVRIEVPNGWQVLSTNTVSVIPFASEPKYFDGAHGYFIIRGAPRKAANVVTLVARVGGGKEFKRTVHIPAPWRAQNNGGDWRILSPSWDYNGGGNAAAVDPFQSFFGFTNDTLRVVRHVYVPANRNAHLRLSSRTFSSNLNLSVSVNGGSAGSYHMRGGMKYPSLDPISIDLHSGWNTIEINCRHTRSQRQFICELTLPDGKPMIDALYDWHLMPPQ